MPTPPQLPSRFVRVQPVSDSPIERVFAAHDTVLQRDVWIKLPGRDAEGWSAPVKVRLLREARALARVRHPAVAPILWVDETPDGPLCVLEPPAGERLCDRLAAGPLDVEEAIGVGVDVAEALAAVHYHGIVHRAVGPRTIWLLPDGRAQLGGFTFAKERAEGGLGSSLAHIRRSGMLRGSVTDLGALAHLPDYSAPEQIDGSGSEPRSDIHALGCTLFRCLTGVEPFAASRSDQPLPDASKLRREVPKALSKVVRTCTAVDKRARFSTAAEVAAALRAAGSAAPVRRLGGRAMVLVLALGGAVAALVVTLLLRGPGDDLTRGAREGPLQGPAGRYEKTFGPSYRRLHGLLIGIGKAYAGGPMCPLNTPVADVEALQAALEANDKAWRGSIRVLREGEATQQRILDALDELELEAQEEDAVLVYFAGHARKRDMNFALCATDATGDVRRGEGYVTREALLSFLDKVKAKHALMILDCCHSGAVFGDATRRDPDEVDARDLQPGAHHLTHFSRELLVSCGPDQLASDGEEHSPFCHLLLAELRGLATGSRRALAARYLSAHIAEAMDGGRVNTSRMQVPEYKPMKEQAGSFLFRFDPK